MKENASSLVHLSLLCVAAIAVTGAAIIGGSPVVFFGILSVFVLVGSGVAIVRSFLGVKGLPALLLAPLATSVPIVIVGSAIYAVYSLTLPVIIILLWLPVLLAFLASRRAAPALDFLNTVRPSLSSILFFGLTVSLLLLVGVALATSSTTESRLGPWDGLSPLLFLFYFLASLLLLTWFTVEKRLCALHLLGLSVHFFVSFSVALIRFPLTFGFDPLLHQAAERLVLEQGAVTPKTFYYIGQYVLIPFLSRVTTAPVELMHQFFLPVLFALSMPVLILFALALLKKTHATASSPFVLAPLFLAVPYPHFIMTTPWGLAYGITFLTILSSIVALFLKSERFASVAGCLACAALAFHPLAGIPLVLFLLLALIARSATRARSVLIGAVSALGVLSVPFAFWLNSRVSTQGAVMLRVPSLDDLHMLSSMFTDFLQTRFAPLLDATYLTAEISWLVLLACAIVGWFFIRTHPLRTLLYAAVMTSVSGIVTVGGIRFESLGQFEQYDYGVRLFQIAILFLLPVAALPIIFLIKKIHFRGNPLGVFIFILIGACVITASFYLSYPRNDAYVPSHAYTLSKTDIATVRAIDQDADLESFVVLANQVVASASIREFGFKTYFMHPSGPVFYYPVPSGSPLVPFYTKMLRQPSRTIANAAMDFVGVSRLYFVVRDYEFRFPIIVRDGKASADAWHEVDGGNAYVFVFVR